MTLDDLNSYSNIGNVIYIPKLIASSGFAILAFYALWFRINQTSIQIKIQEEQIEELKRHKKSDQIIDEMNKISDRILEFSHKIEKPTDSMIKKIMTNSAIGFGVNKCRYENNHSAKITEIEFSNGRKKNIEWTGGTIQNLNAFLTMTKKENPKLSYVELYRNYDESYKSNHHTISSQLKMLIVVAIDLIEIDSAHSSYIRNVLSLHFNVALILEKVGLMEPHYISFVHTLQSLERPKKSININFKKIYLREMKDDGLINFEVSVDDLELKFIEGFHDCEIKVHEKTYHRLNGEYKDVTEQSE
ncbi:hypothetical protein [Marinomonas sp. S3726]|uniref:hypothetical protein n=1 Tax=Marinomonas sp. S3726 TaxID=579484 RepID=UPI0012F6EC90|nr:hypothetical protein [Marinomonas sp. S3726]